MSDTQATPATILVVEDNDDIRDAITQILDEAGYVTRGAATGNAALAYLRDASEAPRVILLDLWMPDMNGMEFREVQRKDPRIASIPVVLLSAATDARQHASALGVAAWLPKPVDLDQLFATVDRFLANG